MNKSNNPPKGGVLWLTSEAVPRVHPDKAGKFLKKSAKMISLLKKEDIPHSLQDCVKDWDQVKEISLKEKVLITPEPWSAGLFDPGDILRVKVSRITDIVSWENKGYKKMLPMLPNQYKQRAIFDTITYTGGTIKALEERYSPSLTIVELIGKHMRGKPSEIIFSRIIPSEVPGVWHIDDFIRPIKLETGCMSASEFVKDYFPEISQVPIYGPYGMPSGMSIVGVDQERLRGRYNYHRILMNQSSPNLFLEILRKKSFLSKSINPKKVLDHKDELVELLQDLEGIYNREETYLEMPREVKDGYLKSLREITSEFYGVGLW